MANICINYLIIWLSEIVVHLKATNKLFKPLMKTDQKPSIPSMRRRGTVERMDIIFIKMQKKHIVVNSDI